MQFVNQEENFFKTTSSVTNTKTNEALSALLSSTYVLYVSTSFLLEDFYSSNVCIVISEEI